MKNLKYLAIAALALCAAGCEDFLSEFPTKSTNIPLERADQLDALLNKPMWVTPNYLAVYATDDTELPKELLTARPANWTGNNLLYYYTFDTEKIPTLANDDYWSHAYTNIYTANLTIENADKVSGDASLRARLKAEAYFVRAFYMWEMANAYCLPYSEENLEEPGLPSRFSTDMEENLRQMTVRETYEAIDRDIEQALQIDVDGVQQAWRSSKGAIYAFLSRYYLHRGEYGKVIEYADLALDPKYKGNAELFDYNNFKEGTSIRYTNPEQTIRTCETHNLGLSGKGMVDWQEFYYMRWARDVYTRFTPSRALVNLFGDPADYPDADELKEVRERDLRFYWFFNEQGNRAINTTILEPMVYRYNRISSARLALSGPSVQEVMLNKAEAIVRSGGDYGVAMGIINALRVKRFKAGADGIDLSAANKDEALKLILEERRRELPFTHRWWDIRRFAYNETPSDDVVVVRDCFELVPSGTIDPSKPKTYTLDIKSRRYAHPYNNIEITGSNGRLQQNKY